LVSGHSRFLPAVSDLVLVQITSGGVNMAITQTKSGFDCVFYLMRL
jgi:uncharacterized protein YodC (DUF2158 family)